MNLMQKIFGISENLTYIYVSIFLIFCVIIIFINWFLKKKNSKISKMVLFIIMIFSIIFILPFAFLVNFKPYGINNNTLWYKQILQFSLLIGNIFMIFYVTFVAISMSIGIIRNIIILIEQKNTRALFAKSFLWFIFVAGISLALINIYRILPIYSFEMSNDPNINFTIGTNPIGLDSNFNNQGYWPFFITNFLIKYFFEGNFNINNNVNNNFDTNPNALNSGIPIYAIVIISIFIISFLIGIYLGINSSKNSIYINKLNKIKKITDKPLKWIISFLPLATFSFFTESLLRSFIGTFIHIGFVILVLLIAWITIFIFSGISVLNRLKIKFKTYIKEIGFLLIQSFKKNNFEKSVAHLNEFIENRVFKDRGKERDKYTKNTISQFYYFSYIADSVVFALITVGYLAFLPSNGYASTSNVNSIWFWLLLFLGSLFTMYGSFEIPNIAITSQNAIASTAMNVMGGTNAGIFAPLATSINRFRIVLNLNYILLLTAFSTSKDFRKEIEKERKII